jgi:hypothetical protein
VVDLVEDDEGAVVLGAHPVTGRVAGHLGVGDDDTVVLRGRLRRGVGELRVERDADAGRGQGPLDLEVFGGDHDGDALDLAVGQQLARDAQGKRRLAGTGRRDGQKILRLSRKIPNQCPTLPAPQSLGVGRCICPHPKTPH